MIHCRIFLNQCLIFLLIVTNHYDNHVLSCRSLHSSPSCLPPSTLPTHCVPSPAGSHQTWPSLARATSRTTGGTWPANSRASPPRSSPTSTLQMWLGITRGLLTRWTKMKDRVKRRRRAPSTTLCSWPSTPPHSCWTSFLLTLPFNVEESGGHRDGHSGWTLFPVLPTTPATENQATSS